MPEVGADSAVQDKYSGYMKEKEYELVNNVLMNTLARLDLSVKEAQE